MTYNTIWIVDDNDDHCELLAETIMDVTSQYRIERKPDAETALSDLNSIVEKQNSLPSLIFMDIKMPRLNGIDALNIIKTHSLLYTIPVIMLSTSSDSREVEECLTAGASMHIAKPLTRQHLSNRVIPELKKSTPNNGLK